MPEYTHTLIPTAVDYAPDPRQIVAFLSALTALGAAPIGPELAVSKLSGDMQSFTNPFTGRSDTRALRNSVAVESLHELALALNGLDDYIVIVRGKGPPKVRALQFAFDGVYDFAVYCRLHAALVSTSDWHDESPMKRSVPYFGRPCRRNQRQGIFCNPNTLEVIEVANAGCACFYVEFEFGKMLFPEIAKSLDLLDPLIVEAATKSFGVRFTQGCHWCA